MPNLTSLPQKSHFAMLVHLLIFSDTYVNSFIIAEIFRKCKPFLKKYLHDFKFLLFETVYSIIYSVLICDGVRAALPRRK